MRIEIKAEADDDSIDEFRVELEVPKSSEVTRNELLVVGNTVMEALLDRTPIGNPGELRADQCNPYGEMLEPRFLAILRGPDMTTQLLGQSHTLQEVEEFARNWITTHVIPDGTDVMIVDVMLVKSAGAYMRSDLGVK